MLPVWGTPEYLSIAVGSTSAAGGQIIVQHGAHPEPGKPDHFEWNPLGTQPSHQREYLSKYSRNLNVNALAAETLYYLADALGNRLFGYAGSQVTKPSDHFLDYRFQSQGQSDAATSRLGYTLTLGWYDLNAGQWPSGSFPMILSANIPTDAGLNPDWQAFTVTQTFTGIFSTASFYSIQSYPGYDPPDQDQQTVNGQQVDLSQVSPGAAKTLPDGDLLRTPMVLYTGTDFPQRPQVVEGQVGDPMVVTDGVDAFDISLKDSNGKIAADAEIQVTVCPRNDHTQADVWTNPFPNVCAGANLVSSGGVLAGVRADQHGYLGLMVGRAPASPGVYYWEVIPAAANTRTYRVNGKTSPEKFFLTYVLTVTGGEILDQNFKVIHDLAVAQPAIIYVRYLLPDVTVDSTTVDITALDANGTAVSSLTGVGMTRLGRSISFLSDPITVNPPGNAIGLAAAHSGGVRPQVVSALTAANGSGKLTAKVQNKPPIEIGTLTDLVFDFRIGQIGSWSEPNLLFGNGSDYVDMSVRVVDAGGKSFPTTFAVGIKTRDGLAEGTVTNVSASPDTEGRISRISFRYTAPSLAAGQTAYVRPNFVFTFTYPDGLTTATSQPQTARPANRCSKALFPYDQDPGSHCFGDPNFPIVYSGYDFRRMVYYRTPTDPSELSDVKYVDVAAMGEAAIQGFLRSYQSRLADLYFVGAAADFDNLAGPFYRINTTDSNNAVGWPAAFIDVNGNGVYDNSATPDIYYTPPSNAPPPAEGYVGISFAHVLLIWCQAKGVNAQVMLTRLQVEQSLVNGITGSTARDPIALEKALSHLMNVGTVGNTVYSWPTVQISQGVAIARQKFDEPTDLPVAAGAHAGHLLPVKKYEPARAPTTTDANFRFSLGFTGPHMPAAFFTQTRSAYALFKYTTQVNTGARGGGNYLFMKTWADFGF